MQLNELLKNLVTESVLAGTDKMCVNHICTDTRDIVEGSVFFALQGIRSHGIEHIDPEQLDLLAALVYEPTKPLTQVIIKSNVSKKVPMIALSKLSEKMSLIASRFYQHPSQRCHVIGITGTNGKTSCTHFIAQLLDGAVIGTMGYGHPATLRSTTHTTPDALTTQKLLNDLCDVVDNISIEVSSHGLSLYRVEGVNFHTVVFTNLSLDHLDFYKNMSEYIAAKKRLFSEFSAKFAVINADDEHAEAFAKASVANGQKVLWFGKNSEVKAKSAYLHFKKICADASGMTVELNYDLMGEKGQSRLQTSVWGEFNIANIVTALLVGVSLGHSIETLVDKAQRLTGVRGRISPIALPNSAVAVIDYAHTPDALQNVLQSVREHTGGKIICLFGCGGDRDRLKRPLMATIAETYADDVIVTDDNPRNEAAENIIADIMSGVRLKEKFTTISGRSHAIAEGLRRLQENDVLVIAGKGHEEYQIIGTQKQDFSDYEEVAQFVAQSKPSKQTKGRDECC